MIDFGKIKEKRNLIGISQEELAFRVQSQQSYISEVERGMHPTASFGIILKIAIALSCDVTDFLDKPVIGHRPEYFEK